MGTQDIGMADSGVKLGISPTYRHFSISELEGIDVTKKSMATDVIDRVGPKGQYLTDEHTFQHFKSEFWFPTLMDRSSWDKWLQKGSKTCGQRVQEKLDHILDTHEVNPLANEVREEINAILARAEERT